MAQRSLQQPVRPNLLSVGAGWRSYWAPYNQNIGIASADTTLGPKILDLQALGQINETSLPSGWFDLGWIKDVALSPQSKIGVVRSGLHGVIRAQYRAQVQETIEFKFRESSRMAYKIATGAQVFNLLKNTVASTVGPLSGSGATKVNMVSYDSSLAQLTVATGSGANFTAGDYIVCDVDYNLTDYGLIGENAAQIYSGSVNDVDYIRKTSDFVSRITSINGDVLQLSQKFVGGGSYTTLPAPVEPPAGSKIQKIRGWSAREGGTSITHWSAMFVLQTIDGAQYVVYYPHLCIGQFRNLAPWQIEDAGTSDISGYELDAIFNALAFDDPIDGQTCVRYLNYIPGPNQDIALHP